MSKIWGLPKTVAASSRLTSDQKVLLSIIFNYYYCGRTISSSALSISSGLTLDRTEKTLEQLSYRRLIIYRNKTVTDINIDLMEDTGILEFGYFATKPLMQMK